MKNNKGFSLIELLAVIVILGVLMIIAIPSVTNYIQNSRKNTYISTVRGLIDGARALVSSGKLRMNDTDVSYYIPSSCITTENDSKTPYGEFAVSNIIINYDGEEYKYYWSGVDESGVGIPAITSYEDLDGDLLETDLSVGDIMTISSVDGRSNIATLDTETCSKFTKATAVIYNFSSTTTESDTCEVQSDFICNAKTIGQEYIASCIPKYGTVTTTTTNPNATSCSSSGTSFGTCTEEKVGQSYSTVTRGSYSKTGTTTSASSSCATTPAFSCNATNLGRTYIASCTPVNGTFSTETTTSGSCTTQPSFSCTPPNNGRCYVASCTKISTGTNSYRYRKTIRKCSGAGYRAYRYLCTVSCTRKTYTCKRTYDVVTKKCEQN